MRISDYARESARRYGARPAISDDSRTVTFGELNGEIDRRAAWLRRHGVGAGGRVAVLSKNSIDYAVLYCAAAEVGAVTVPLNWRLRATELTDLLRRSEAVAVCAGPEFVGSLAELRLLLPRVRVWSTLTEYEAATTPAVSMEQGNSAILDLHDIAVQMYTGGTSGTARGVMLTHGNLWSMVSSWLQEVPLRSGVHGFLQVTPLFHVGGLLMLLSTLAAGVHLELHAEFFPGPTLTALSDRRITHTLLVPAMIQWLLAEPGARAAKFPTLDMIIYGAAPMPLALLEDALGTFKCSFLQGYGLTETSGVLTVLRPDDHKWSAGEPPPPRIASAGRATSCCDVRVVRPDGGLALPGEVGEVVARGANVMAGYYGDPDATAEAFRDGWFHTGDLATVDHEGFVYLVDRQKDMIIVGGENVYPQEIESALRQHFAVADAAVIGIPHATWGEEVLAFITLQPGIDVSDRELIHHCRLLLARFKCPTKVEFRTDLPRNAAGKLLKRELRAPYWSGQLRQI